MKMKRTVTYTLLVLAVAAAAAAVVWRCVSPRRQVIPLFERYRHADGIAASYIHNYHVNDTLLVDVTLLEALSDTGWAMLQHNFNIPIVPKEWEKAFYADGSQTALKMVPKDNPSLPMDTIIMNNDLVAISYPRRSICVFSIESMSQLKTLMRKKMDDNVLLKR